RYNNIFESPLDAAITPTRSPRRGLGNNVQLGLRPFESLTADFTLEMDRDLLDATLASTRPVEQRALDAARRSIAGVDVGWGTNRSLNSSVAWRPPVATWVGPSVTMTTRSSLDRNPSYLEIDVDQAGDSTGVLRQKFQADRSVNRALRIRPGSLFRADTTAGSVRQALGAVGRRLEALDIAWNTTVGSNYDRERTRPGFGYQLGWSYFDDMRFLGGDTASTARTREEWRVASGVRLPYNAMLDLTYRDVGTVGFDRFGGERTQDERTWPGLRLALNQIPLPLTLRRYIQ